MSAFDNTIPINVDRNVTSSDYADHSGDRLLMHSLFYTVQGEGPYAGWPALFIRLGGCNFGAKNVACHGCDTAFAVSQSGYAPTKDLLAITLKTFASGSKATPLVVLTGGEPLLQNVIPLITLLESSGVRVQVETNGTQRNMLRRVVQETDATVVISPKPLCKSGYAAWPPVIDDAEDLHFKFLVCADPASHHHTVPDWAKEFNSVYVSPVTVYLRAPCGEAVSAWDSTLVDQPATAANYAHAAKVALANGFKVSVQTHTFLGVL